MTHSGHSSTRHQTAALAIGQTTERAHGLPAAARKAVLVISSMMCAFALLATAHAADWPPPPPGAQAAPVEKHTFTEEVGSRSKKVNADVLDLTTPVRETIEAGTIINLRSVKRSPKPDGSEPILVHNQTDETLDTPAPNGIERAYRKEAASPASPLPAEAAQRDPGDAIRSFLGADSADTNSVPPDMVLGVGPNHIVEAINSGFVIYTKLGNVEEEYIQFSNFFTAPAGWQGRMFDPRVHYDPFHNRFIMLIVGRDDANSTSYYWTAVSETSDPTGNWCKRRGNTLESSGGVTRWLDFAALGSDSFGVYVTGNLIDFAGNEANDAALRAFPAEYMTSCGAITGFKWTNVLWPNGDSADSLQPALAHTINGDGETFFVNTYPNSGDQVMLSRVSGDRVNGPTLTKAVIDIPAHDSILVNVDQPGTTTDLDGGRSKPLSAVYANRRVFFSMTDDVNNDGSSAGWLTVKLNTNTNTREWHHLLWGGPGFYYIYPALTLDGTGQDNNLAVFGSWTDAETTNSASTRFPSGLVRLYEDQPVSNGGRFTSLTAGTTAYTFIPPTGTRARWGDYSGAAYDWTCGHAWGVIQAATGSNTWRTTIAGRQFDDEDPCALLDVTTPHDSDLIVDSGDTLTVRWESANLPAGDDIYVFVEAEGLSRQIGGPLSVNSTSYAWTIEEWADSGARIGVGSWNGASYTKFDWSKPFTIRDRTAPTPDPMTWQTTPEPPGLSRLTMTVSQAFDGSDDPVEYQFDFTDSPTGGTGGTGFDWGSANTFINAGLDGNHEYCYRARARDAAFNTTDYSSIECGTTRSTPPQLITFGNTTGFQIGMTWASNGNAPGTQYEVQNTTLGVTSGWRTQTQWLNTGLENGTTYNYRARSRNSDGLQSVWVNFGSATTTFMDGDGDGVPKPQDNCSLQANPNQRDTDGDGYGNACDQDLNQDCVVNVVDLGLLRNVFFTNDGNADFNADGIVNVQDLGILRSAFFGEPGPSGTTGTCVP